MKTIKLYKKEEIQDLPKNGKFNLEIYVENVEISVKEIFGFCIVRAKFVSFPNLEVIHDFCSLDASGIQLPKLKKVNGNLRIHEFDSFLPELLIVNGDIYNKNELELPKLKSFREIKLKDKKKLRSIITIRTKNDLNKIPDYSFFQLKIDSKEPIIIPLKEIKASLQLVNFENVSFPNLEIIHGNLMSSNKYNGTFQFPKLKHIKGKLRIQITEVFLNELITLKENLILENYQKLHMNKLKEIDSLIIYNNTTKLPALEIVNQYIDSDYYQLMTTYTLPSLKYVNDLVGRNLELPNLKKIHGQYYYSNTNSGFNKIEFIGSIKIWEYQKVYLNYFKKSPEIFEKEYSSEIKNIMDTLKIESFEKELNPIYDNYHNSLDFLIITLKNIKFKN
ncbi:hypothetical protein [Aureivirga marina]|uniref:hypothetical protein n=1 Tax=Aureivirga marina TaxID=1182451 RepID=UPI0018C96C37|nr:hypothetical protein [Aureivirga marina]